MTNDISKPFISLIATFYNLEDCVDYCLKSILAQEYTNFELLCIDDGSTDSTRSKLDQFTRDPRVRVITQENSGPSCARNTGIKNAKGEFISFVDGDDLVSPYYLSSLLEALQQSDADMAIGTLEFVPAEDLKEAARTWVKPSHFHTLTSTRALEEVLCHKRDVTGCVKLARRDIYNDSFFPEGRFHEDLCTIADLFERTTNVVVVDDVIYKYIQREGSNMHGFVNLDKRSSDFLQAIEHITEVSKRLNIDLSYIELYRCNACLRLHNNGGAYVDSAVLRSYVREHLTEAIQCSEVAAIDRFTLKLFAFGLKPYDIIRSLKLKVSPNMQ